MSLPFTKELSMLTTDQSVLKTLGLTSADMNQSTKDRYVRTIQVNDILGMLEKVTH